MGTLPTQAHSAITPLALQSVLVDEGQERAFAREVVARLMLGRMDATIASLQQVASGDEPDWDAISKLQQLRKAREELRLQVA